MINFIKKLTATAVILTGVIAFSGLTATPAYAGLFDASKNEACKGANLQNTSGEECENGGTKSSTEAATKIETTIKNIINLISVVVGVIAIILIIINGLRFITSNGDSGNVTSAKNGVIYAIVGLIIVALAQVIVRFVLTKV